MKLALPANHGGVVTHRLDPARIIETAENLATRRETCRGAVCQPCRELRRAPRRQRSRPASKQTNSCHPACLRDGNRIGFLGVRYLVDHIHARCKFGTITELFEATDAGFNLVVILAGALWFLITLEARLK